MRIPTLTTDRLRLVPPSARAIDLYRRFYTDATASRAYGGPLSAGAAASRLEADRDSWQTQGFGVWLIEREADDELIGVCGFWQGAGWPRELTWWLLPAARGHGFAQEASRAAVAHAYRVFQWPTVETCMNDTNEAAMALAQRLGGVVVSRQVFPDGLERNLYRIPDGPKPP